MYIYPQYYQTNTELHTAMHKYINAMSNYYIITACLTKKGYLVRKSVVNTTGDSPKAQHSAAIGRHPYMASKKRKGGSDK